MDPHELINETQDNPENQEDQDKDLSPADRRLNDVVTFLLIFTAMFAALASYFASIIDTLPADRAGILAVFNDQSSRIQAEAESAQSYAIYSDYAITNALNQRFDALLSDPDADFPQEYLEIRRQELQATADILPFFFPTTYIQPDGSYSRHQEVETILAERARRLDMDPAPHFAKADAARAQVRAHARLMVLIAFTLSFYALVMLIRARFRRLRYGITVLGTATLVYSMILFVQIEGWLL